MRFLAVLRYELAKITRRRTPVYVIGALNLYPLIHTALIVAVWTSGKTQWIPFVADALGVYAIAHVANAHLVLPMCMALLTTEVWIQERTQRRMETMVLTQVPRSAILLGKTVAIFLVPFAGMLLFFGLFLAEALVMRRMIDVPLAGAQPFSQYVTNLTQYLPMVAVSLIELTALWGFLGATMASGKAAMAVYVLGGLGAWALYGVFYYNEVEKLADWTDRLISASGQINGPQMIKPVLQGQKVAWADSQGALIILAVSALAFLAASWYMLRVKEFHE